MTVNASNDYPHNTDSTAPQIRQPWWKVILAAVAPLLVLVLAVMVAFSLISSGPKAAKKPPQRIVPLVQVEPARFTDEQVVVHTMGQVVPSRNIELKTSVAGEVIYIHPAFTEGGLVTSGETLLKIDPTDYRLRLVEQEAVVAQAQYNLKLELGHQEVARREWDLIGQEKSPSKADEDLALRRPHLQKVRAELNAAKAQLDQARKNLERTVVKAPFNAMVSDPQVDKGSQVAAQTSLATLTGTDQYWVQVSIPVDRLNWISIPRRKDRSGSSVTVRQGNSDTTWQGEVVRLMGELDPQGRMARLLVSVDDPLRLASDAESGRPLLMGAYVHADISGKEVRQVVRLSRPFIHENDTVWIMAEDDTLSIRPISILWRDASAVLVNQGIALGDKIIVSDLPAPVDGMQIRTTDEMPTQAGAKENNAS